jgi:hypothetical protein
MNKKLKKGLLITATVIATLPVIIHKYPYYTSEAQEYCDRVFNHYTPEVESGDLQINCDNTFRYVVHCSEKDGQKELVSLAQDADREEGWIFLPKEELWIEVGMCQSDMSVFFNPTIVNMICTSTYPVKHDFSELHFYHLHPRDDLSPLRKDSYERFYSWTDRWKELHDKKPDSIMALFNKWVRVKNVMPSGGDISSMLYEDLRTSMTRTAPLKSYIASSEGITEYTMTDAAIEIRNQGVDSINTYQARYDLKNTLMYKRYGEERMMHESIEELCKSVDGLISDDTVCVYFTPKKDILNDNNKE